jgi:putative intracellular protease/amidase
MKKQVLFVILDQYADWEAAYLSTCILALGKDDYAVKTVSLGKDPISSAGGFTVLPDYALQSVPAEYEALILIGGMKWLEPSALAVKNLVQEAVLKHRIVGAICLASAFLGVCGVLNEVRHTSNDLAYMQQWAGTNYTGAGNYIKEQAVRDDNIITANGTATLEFTREVLLALNIAPESNIKEWYNFHKLGFYNAPMPKMP